MNQLIEKSQLLKTELNAIVEVKRAEISRGTNDVYALETVVEICQIIGCIDDTIAMLKSSSIEIKEATDLIEDIRQTYIN